MHSRNFNLISAFLWILLGLVVLFTATAHGQSAQTPINNLVTSNTVVGSNVIAVLMRPNATNGTVKITLSNLLVSLKTFPHWSAAGQGATNNTTTNATMFGLFDQLNGSVFQFFGLEQGTNIVLYRNGSNVVINSSASGSGGSTAVTTNANQFAANPVLTIKDGAVVTNLVVRTTLLVDGSLTTSNAGTGAFSATTDNGIFGDNVGTYQVGNWNGPILDFVTSGNSIDPNGNPRTSLGRSSAPFNGVYATNFFSKKSINLGGLTVSRALALNGSGDVTNVVSSDPSNEYVKADGTTGVPSGSGGAATNLSWGATLFVDAVNGNNSTAVRGDAARPFLNVTNAIVAAQNGDTIFIRPGTYVIKASTNTFGVAGVSSAAINSKTNLSIIGSGPGTVLQFNEHGDGIPIYNSSNITFRNFTLSGTRITSTPDTYKFALQLLGANKYLVFEDLNFVSWTDHCLGGDYSAGTENDYVWVTRCRFTSYGYATSGGTLNTDGAGVQVSGSHWFINQCFFKDGVQGVEIFNRDTSSIKDVWVVNSLFENMIWRGVFNEGNMASHAGISVLNNSFRNITMSETEDGTVTNSQEIAAILVKGGSDWKILGNTIDSVRGSKWTNINQGIGIILINAKNSLVAQNTVKGNKGDGILVDGFSGISSNVVLSGNTVVSNGAFGIRTYSGIGIVLENNVVQNNGQMVLTNGAGTAGIYVQDGSGVVIRNNRLGNTLGITNQSPDILLSATATNTIRAGNRFSTATDLGVNSQNLGEFVNATNANFSAMAGDTAFHGNFTLDGGIMDIAADSFITMQGLTASRVVVTGGSKEVASSTVTTTELGYVSGVTSALQTQLNAKASDATAIALTNLAYTIGSNGTNYTDSASSNRVRLVGGTGGITVSQAGSGGVQTWTINDDDAGGGATTNFAAIFSGYGAFGDVKVTNTLTMSSPAAATIHIQTNTGAVALQHSLFVNGRIIPNIEKVSATSIAIGNSSGPDYSLVSSVTTNLTFSGTPIHGQRHSLTVTNSGATNILIGFPSAYSPQVYSNVTSWTVLASNYVTLPFVYSTNQVGGGMWRLDRVTEYDAQLDVGSAGNNGFLALSTNTLGTRIAVTNTYIPQSSSMVLSNIAGMASQYWTNAQASSMVLSNLVGTVANNATNAGWGIAIVNGTVTLTNRPASIATNATSVTLDFSDAANVNILNAWWHLTTNLVISPTNLIVGRTMAVYFNTNSISYDVTFTNTAATPVRWNFNVATNGSTSFTKTNTLRARVFLTAETNGVITADMGYYR